MTESKQLQVGVKILLKNSEGRFLLVRSNIELYPEKQGRWDIVGGRINPGSTLLENLKREVLEETGLSVLDLPVLAGAQDILKNSSQHIVRLTYLGQTQGEPSLNLENVEFKWFSREDLLSLKTEELDQYFKELLESDQIFSK